MLNFLRKAQSLKPYCDALKEGQTLLIEKLWDGPKALLIAIAQEVTKKQILVVTGGAREGRLLEDLPFFTQVPVHEFPAWETLPSEEIAPSPDIVGARYAVLEKLLENPKPSICICPLQSCLQRLLPSKKLKRSLVTLKVGEEVPFAELIAVLDEMGFERRPVAADKGEYAVRGGIIDIFPVGSPDPFRVEFFADRIEAIRAYDAAGQCSVKKVGSFHLTPAKEWELLKESEEMASLLDYLGQETLLILDDLAALEDRFVSLKQLPGAISRSFISFDQFLKETSSLQKLYWIATSVDQIGSVKQLEEGVKAYSIHARPKLIEFPIFGQQLQARLWSHPFSQVDHSFLLEEGEELLPALQRSVEMGISLEFVCENKVQEDRLKERIKEAGLKLSSPLKIHEGYLSTGFVIEADGFALIPMTEFTHRYRIRRQKLRSSHHVLSHEHFALSPGDLVVHFHNGIGRYLGVERKPNHEGIETEFLAIEYADQGKLYVPAVQAYLVTKYVGSQEHETPTLHTLGSSRWARMRSAAELTIRDYAAELLTMHAQRELAQGYAYPLSGKEVKQFEEEFPYQETEDQLKAIADVFSDMEACKPMDRLVCGDVGYGKTEVAMRAAFKAVVDGGKQVALLVPTTVLAMQHYENFVDRMANFPVRLAVLSRFRSAKQQKETLEAVRSGSIDILIGTHRIISEDVQFKDLGLVIIDEEQRFGVRAKEKIRSFKAGVDCMALSATPIPRTLYLSLMGARDLSIINTPPQDRLPIKMVVTENEDERLKSAILRELSRDGQVYYIHNRVETIYGVAQRLQKLLPQARIAVGHGQLDSDALDKIIHAFKGGEADILVATTIVENGVDIPNANTIIVERADHYGLADLYQLRGRVGRWNRRAYAYFLVPPQKELSEISRKRLSALLEIGSHGAGLRVAMRDLEIRGAGNILGTEQSGCVSAVGFHLYCDLLNRSVKNLRHKTAVGLMDTKLDFPQDARIPDTYIDEPSLRMEIHQRFGKAEKEEEVDQLLEEITDRFGKPPLPVLWLYHIMRLRVLASKERISALKLRKLTLTIERQKGKKVESKMVVMPPATTPQELEERVRKAILA